MIEFEKMKGFGEVYLIAEIGVNYYDIAKEEGLSPMEAAELMVDKAAEAGVHAVKFQTYKGEKLVTSSAPSYWDTEKECTTSQRELFKKFDGFGFEEYRHLADHCRRKGIDFLSTPFDFEAADYLDPLMDFYKISSSDITNTPFIKYMAQKDKPILLSTGASSLEEIRNAIQAVEDCGNDRIALLHCILEYPTPDCDANLRMIKGLAKEFPQYVLGYSDHTLPDPQMDNLFVAYLLGARIIEKHFTLDKSLPGNDHYHAMDPADAEKFLKKADRYFSTIAGTEKKEPLRGESDSRKYARRSIVSRGDIAKGEILTRDKITFKRPGTGIPPSQIEKIIGTKARIHIPDDTTITKDMLGG